MGHVQYCRRRHDYRARAIDLGVVVTITAPYTTMLYLGCVAGIYAGTAVAGAEGMSAARFALTAVALLPPALIGARLWFVLQHLRQFRIDPRRIWRRTQGGSAVYGGLVLSVLVSGPV